MNVYGGCVVLLGNYIYEYDEYSNAEAYSTIFNEGGHVLLFTIIAKCLFT